MKKIFTFVMIISFFTALNAAQKNNDVVADKKYSESLLLIAEKKYDNAIVLLNSIEKESSNKDYIYYHLAECYMNKNDNEKALKYAYKSIDENEKFVKSYLLAFNIYQATDNYEEAVSIIHQLLENNPDMVDYYFTLGYIYINNLENYNLSGYYFNQYLKSAEKEQVPAKYKELSNLFLADVYYNQQKYDLAIESIQKSVKFNNNNNLKFFQFANYLISNNYLDESVKALQLFVDNLSDDQKQSAYLYRVYAYLGSMYYINDDTRSFEYLQIGAKDTTSNEGQISKMLISALQKKDDEALKEMEPFVDKNPNYIALHKALAEIYERKGDSQKAYDHYIAAGIILYNTNLFDSTRKILMKACSIKPEVPKLNFMLGEIYEKTNQYSMAIYYYKKYDSEEKDPDLLIHIAYLYHLQKRIKERDSSLAKAMKTNPNNPNLYFTRGIISNNEEKYKDSIADFKKAISLKKDNPAYYFYLAVAQEKMKDYKNATESLKSALIYDKDNASYLNYLGYLYVDMNIHLDDAVKMINSALEQSPHNGAYLDSLGWAYYRQGKFKEAEKFLLKAKYNLIAEDNVDPVVYDHLGDTYNKLGKKDLAIKYWGESLKVKFDSSVQSKLTNAKKESSK